MAAGKIAHTLSANKTCNRKIKINLAQSENILLTCITQNRPISANNLLIETINYFKLFLQLVLN